MKQQFKKAFDLFNRKLRIFLYRDSRFFAFPFLLLFVFAYIYFSYKESYLNQHLKQVQGDNRRLSALNLKLQSKLEELAYRIDSRWKGENLLQKSLVSLSNLINNATVMGLMDGVAISNKETSLLFNEGVGGLEIECGDSCNIATLLPRAESNQMFSNSYNKIIKITEIVENIPYGMPGNGYITSYYGIRRSPFTGKYSMHRGVDISLAYGSRVEATANGVVITIRRSATYGLMVDIEHSNKITTRYAHLSKVLVKKGQVVCRGQRIALSGSSGRSTAPHLHYEVRSRGRAVNPLPFLGVRS